MTIKELKKIIDDYRGNIEDDVINLLWTNGISISNNRPIIYNDNFLENESEFW